MADQLLFRGGNTVSIAGSTVSNREIVIDTQTNQIVLGSAKDRTVMEDGTTGRAGIGTSAPQRQLHVSGTATNILRLENTSADVAGIELKGSSGTSQIFHNAGDLRFLPNGTEQMRVTGTGVGIGTTSPQKKLHVYESSTANAAIRVQGGGLSDSVQLFHGTGGYGLFSDSPTQAFTISTDASERFRITSDGKVGIGIGNPSSALHIVTGSTSGTNTGEISLGNVNGHVSGKIAGHRKDGSYRGELLFYTSGNLAGTVEERMRLDSNGSLKIGGTLPASPNILLNTNGDATFNGPVSITNGGTLNSGKHLVELTSETGYSFKATQNGVAKFVVAPGGSAQFAGSVSIGGLTAANTIDEYEEGTFTPDLTIGGVAVGATGYGAYTRIGNVCQVTLSVTISSAAASGRTGSLSITGLPFTSPNNPYSNYTVAYAGNQNFAADYANGNKSIYVTNSSNSTLLAVFSGSRNTGRLDESAFNFNAGNNSLYLTFTYRVV